MYNLVTTLAAVVVVLGFLVLIHEFGHYAMAKLFKVRVEVFSIGFGKRLFGFTRGDTDYRISALPFGGYVRMTGENPLETRSDDPAAFMNHPRWQRFIIAIAGPFMNVALAVTLLTAVYMVRYEHPYFLDKPAVIGWVMENSAAEKSGFLAGDRIVRIDNKQNPTWEDVEATVLLNPGQTVDVGVERNGQFLDKTVVPEKAGTEDYGRVAGWIPQEPNLVTEIESDKPAAKAGMKVGDEVIAANGVPMTSMQALIHYLQQNQGKPVDVTVLRNGQQINLNITPILDTKTEKPQWRLGFRSAPTSVDKLGFTQAVHRSVDSNKRYSLLIFELVKKLAERKVSMKQIDGPIGIARASGEAARQEGWTPLLALMAAISLNLGIFNMFPIPIMDGGVILLLAIESLMRRDISVRIKERIYQAAFVFLILFAAIVIYNDLGKALPGLAKFLP